MRSATPRDRNVEVQEPADEMTHGMEDFGDEGEDEVIDFGDEGDET